MPISSETDRVIVPSAVVARPVGDRLVLLNASTGRYFSLDSTGARVWALIGEGTVFGDMRDTLLAEFAADPATLQDDLRVLIEQLESLDLVEVRRD